MPAKKHVMKKAKSAAGKSLAKGKKMNEVKPLAVDAYMQFKD
jgi:hypothetical protein